MDSNYNSNRTFRDEIFYPNASSSEHNQMTITVTNQTSIPRPILNHVLQELQQNANLVNVAGNITISNINSDSPATTSPNQSSDSVTINISDNGAPNRSSHNWNVTDADGNNLMSQLRQAINNTNVAGNASLPTNTSTISNVTEVQHSLECFQKYLPFILILISRCIYDYCDILFHLSIIFATFMHANSIVKREATKQTRRSLLKLAVPMLYIMSCFLFIAFAYEKEKLYLNLIFIHTYKHFASVWFLLWTLLITDFILKLVTVFLKLLFTMLPAGVISFQKRGKIYLFMESVSQLYRSLVTIQPWLYYLLESYNGTEKIVGVFLSAAYMVSKGSDLMSRIRLLKTAILKLLQNVALGSSPNKDQIQTAGNHCPICHDEYDSPVLLQCRHIFCESCVSTWFDREQTCPLCRAKIVEDPSWRDGSTTYFLQLF